MSGTRTLGDSVAATYDAGYDDPGVEAAQAELAAGFVVDPVERIEPEPPRELGAAGMRLIGDLDRRRPEHQLGAGREVVLRQVEVDVQLIAGECPAVGILGDEGDEREFITLSCMSGWDDPSSVRLLPRMFHVSPTTP